MHLRYTELIARNEEVLEQPEVVLECGPPKNATASPTANIPHRTLALGF